MKHFLIYTNQYKDRGLETTQYIRQYLEARDLRVSVKLIEREKDPAEKIPQDADCMIVLGGDGTVLQAVREKQDRHLPIVGVNLGTLGYMTEVELINLDKALERLVEGDYE